MEERCVTRTQSRPYPGPASRCIPDLPCTAELFRLRERPRNWRRRPSPIPPPLQWSGEMVKVSVKNQTQISCWLTVSAIGRETILWVCLRRTAHACHRGNPTIDFRSSFRLPGCHWRQYKLRSRLYPLLCTWPSAIRPDHNRFSYPRLPVTLFDWRPRRPGQSYRSRKRLARLRRGYEVRFRGICRWEK